MNCRRLDLVIGAISRSLAWLAGACTIAVLLVIAADVLNRNVTGGSVAGAYEAVSALMVLITLLGLGYAARSDSNVRMSLVATKMPRQVARAARVLGEAVTLAIAVWFAYASWEAVLVSWDRGEFTQGLVNFTVWPMRAAIALGFSFLGVEQVLIIWGVVTKRLSAHESASSASDPAADSLRVTSDSEALK